MKKSAVITLNKEEVQEILRKHFNASTVVIKCKTMSHGDQRDSWTSAVFEHAVVTLPPQEYDV